MASISLDSINLLVAYLLTRQRKNGKNDPHLDSLNEQIATRLGHYIQPHEYPLTPFPWVILVTKRSVLENKWKTWYDHPQKLANFLNKNLSFPSSVPLCLVNGKLWHPEASIIAPSMVWDLCLKSTIVQYLLIKINHYDENIVSIKVISAR